MIRSSLPSMKLTSRVNSRHPCRGDDATQSDRILADRIRRELRRTGYGDLSRVTVLNDGQWVALAGRVPTFHLKQMAQEVVRRIAPAHQIYNQLRVSSSRSGPGNPR